MLPSRGFRSISRIHSLSNYSKSLPRQFSAGLSSNSRCRTSPSTRILASAQARSGKLATRYSISASLPGTVRFQSSAATSTSASTVESATTTSTPSIAEISSSSLDALPDLTTQLSPTIIPSDQIGYLKSLGLEYGWGVTSSIQWLLEHIHVYTGTPWWGSIIITAVIVRAIMLKTAISSSDASARMAALAPVLKPLQQKQQHAQLTGDQEAAVAARTDFIQALQGGGVKMSRVYLPLLWQMVIGIASFRLLRGMTSLPVPELETGGFLWLTDLTIADPYYILPVGLAGLLHVLLRLGGEQGVQPMGSKLRNAMIYGFPFLTLAGTSFLPAALQLSFATSSAWGLIQAYILRQPHVRERLGIAPIVPTSSVASTPSSRYNGKPLNLSTMWQPPNPTGSTERVKPVETGILAGAKNEVSGMIKEAREKTKQWTGRGGAEAKLPSGKTKAFLQQAEEYEKRRRRELEYGKKDRRRGR